MKPLSDKCVVLVAPTGGLGPHLARGLAAAGAKLVLAGRNRQAVSAVAAGLPGEPLVVEADVTDRASIDRAIAAALERHGSIWGLVNNAGVSQVAPFLLSKPAAWEKMLAVNVAGAAHCTQAVLRPMIRARAGRIVHISSAAAKIGAAQRAIYGATKAAVNQMVRTVAEEVGPFNITVNAVCPGFMELGMADAHALTSREAIVRALPIRRFVEPGEVADTAVFLLSAGAGAITGQALSVCGGKT